MESLALEIRGCDQALFDRPGCEPPFDLRRQIAPGSPRPILLDVGEVVLVRRTEQAARKCRSPGRGVAADACPNTTCSQSVAAVVERVGVGEGDWIEAVELVVTREREARGAKLDIRRRMPGCPQP